MSTAIKPITVEESNLIFCSIALDADSADYGAAWQGEWAAGTYALGDVVYSGITLYESLAGSNTDVPSEGAVLEVPTWLELGVINRWRLFDEYISDSISYDTDEIVYTLSINNIDNVAFFDLIANELKVEILDTAGATTWEYTQNLLDEAMSFGDWWEYYYVPSQDTERDIAVELGWLVNSDLGEQVRITISGSGTVSCGMCMIGYGEDLGKLQWDFTGGDLNYSTITTDQWGRDSFVAGASAKLISGTIKIPIGSESYIYKLLSKLKGEPVVFNLNNSGVDYDMLIVYGVIKEHSHVAYSINNAICSVTIRGRI